MRHNGKTADSVRVEVTRSDRVVNVHYTDGTAAVLVGAAADAFMDRAKLKNWRVSKVGRFVYGSRGFYIDLLNNGG